MKLAAHPVDSRQAIRSCIVIRAPAPYARRIPALAAVLAITLMLFLQQPQAVSADPGSVDDCFGGILAQDVVHCNVIQDAHNEGVLTVEKMYTASNGELLYIFITQGEPDLEGIFEQLKARADEEINALGDPHLCPPPRLSGQCEPGTFPDYRNGPTMMPESEVYVDVRLRGGGAAARHGEAGWASFLQVWPPPDDDGATRADPEPTFDVSDVDTSRPRIDCGDIWADHKRVCPELKRYPDLALTRWEINSATWYIEVKALPGQEEEAVAEVRAALSARYSSIAEDPSTLVVIPVKYSYEELWHWRTILDRFARSAGNTVGVFDAWLMDNRAAAFAYGTKYVFPDPPGLEPIMSNVYDEADLRTTIAVLTLDLEATLAALPRLLPQLGIPVDAVGLALQPSNKPHQGSTLAVYETGPSTGPAAAPAVAATTSPRRAVDSTSESMAVDNNPQTADHRFGERLLAFLAIVTLMIGSLAITRWRRRRA